MLRADRIQLCGIFPRIVAVLIIALSNAVTLGGARTKEFHVGLISPVVFIETKKSGEKINHSIVEARVEAWSGASLNEMNAFADGILASNIHIMAENNNSEFIWVTFFLEKTLFDGKDGWKTYRVIFVKERTGWKRLQKGAKVDVHIWNS